MLKRFTTLLFCALPMLNVGVPAHAQQKTHHVVFVITSGTQDDWARTMALTDHFIAGVKPEPSEIEVLAYGPGIRILTPADPFAEKLASLQKMGVRFVACENALRSEKLTKADLLPGVTSVPSGVVELVRRQESGYSYVKVGE